MTHDPIPCVGRLVLNFMWHLETLVLLRRKRFACSLLCKCSQCRCHSNLLHVLEPHWTWTNPRTWWLSRSTENRSQFAYHSLCSGGVLYIGGGVPKDPAARSVLSQSKAQEASVGTFNRVRFRTRKLTLNQFILRTFSQMACVGRFMLSPP